MGVQMGLPLKPKQYVLLGLTAVCVNVPMFVWAVNHADENPRRAGVLGLINIVVGVSVLLLIFKKWIRKMK
jgi:hypothetical protein